MTTTVKTFEEAKQIGTALVELSIVASVQIIPAISSIYFWKGKIRTENELLLLMNTRKECVELIKEYLKEHHSYEVPECIVTPIIDGTREYLTWIEDNSNRQ